MGGISRFSTFFSMLDIPWEVKVPKLGFVCVEGMRISAVPLLWSPQGFCRSCFYPKSEIFQRDGSHSTTSLSHFPPTPKLPSPKIRKSRRRKVHPCCSCPSGHQTLLGTTLLLSGGCKVLAEFPGQSQALFPVPPSGSKIGSASVLEGPVKDSEPCLLLGYPLTPIPTDFLSGMCKKRQGKAKKREEKSKIF